MHVLGILYLCTCIFIAQGATPPRTGKIPEPAPPVMEENVRLKMKIADLKSLLKAKVVQSIHGLSGLGQRGFA